MLIISCSPSQCARARATSAHAERRRLSRVSRASPSPNRDCVATRRQHETIMEAGWHEGAHGSTEQSVASSVRPLLSTPIQVSASPCRQPRRAGRRDGQKQERAGTPRGPSSTHPVSAATTNTATATQPTILWRTRAQQTPRNPTHARTHSRVRGCALLLPRRSACRHSARAARLSQAARGATADARRTHAQAHAHAHEADGDASASGRRWLRHPGAAAISA